jgi:hypothetical protein
LGEVIAMLQGGAPSSGLLGEILFLGSGMIIFVPLLLILVVTLTRLAE